MPYSPLIAKLIEALRVLPGVGPKSAQRMAFELLQRKRESGLELASTLSSAMELVGNCDLCRNFCETEVCNLCSDNRRNNNNICVVESPADVIAVEQTGCFNGYYFVLMGHLSPLDGIGPNDIGVPKLLSRVRELSAQELIIATNSTPEGEATAFYITEQVKELNVACSRIAHGIPIGGELEYLDSGTVSKALFARTHIVTENSSA